MAYIFVPRTKAEETMKCPDCPVCGEQPKIDHWVERWDWENEHHYDLEEHKHIGVESCRRDTEEAVKEIWTEKVLEYYEKQNKVKK
jgi:hypothetical protein